MIFKRKDKKTHGTQNMIEGAYKKDDRCLIVDDVITSGISIMETVEVNFRMKILFEITNIIKILAGFVKNSKVLNLIYFKHVLADTNTIKFIQWCLHLIIT